MDQAGTFGEYVAAHRVAKGYTARELARRTGVAPSTITRLEAGTHTVPYPDLLVALIDVLDLDAVVAVNLIAPYRALFRQVVNAQKGSP